MAGTAPHPFTLRQLQYVIAVADARSFRRAAEACRVSQPSLSAQIAEVEDRLAVRLFERDRRRVLVTAAGAVLLERARRILVEADDLVDAATRASDLLSGTLRVGVIPTISPYLLPAVAPRLKQALPRLTLVWVEDKTGFLVERLDAGELDAAIVATKEGSGGFEREEIADDPFVLAAARAHPLGRSAEPASARDLRGADVLLLDDGHCFRDQALAFCGATRTHELGYRATSLPTLVQMVAAGAGVTLLPTLAVRTEAARATLRIRPFADPVPHRTIALVWRKRSPLDPALRRLAAEIRAAYPSGRRGRGHA